MTDVGGDDDLPIELSVTNATIKSVAVSGSGTNTVTTNTASAPTKATFTANVTATQTMVMTVVLYPVAAGTTITITADADLDPSVDGTSFSIVTIASAAVSVVDVSSTTSKASADTNITANTAGTEWGFVYTAVAEVAIDVRNTYGDVLNTAVLAATVSGNAALGVGLSNDDDDCAGANPPAGYDSTFSIVSDGDSTVCLRRLETTDVTIAGTATLTITAGGKTLKTITVNVYGDVASIAVTAGDATAAVGAALDGTADQYLAKLTYKDAAGNTLPLAAGGQAALDDAVSFKNSAGTVVATLDAGVAADFDDFLGDGNGADNDGATAAAGGYVSYALEICTTSVYGDNTFSANYTNAGSNVLTANVAIKCTSTASKITGIAMEKELVGPGEKFDVELTAIDSNGYPLGYLGTISNATTLVLSPATGTAAGEIRASNSANAQVVTDFQGVDWGIVDGAGAVEVTAPTTKGTYTMVLTYTDIDGTATGDQAGTYTLTITVRDTNLASKSDLTAGPKKKIATADFGPGAAGLKVAFVLENAKGVTKTFYRKANASGKATYTIALRGTWTVYATFGDSITDTVTLQK